MFGPNLLLDRLGFINLDLPLPHEIWCVPLANGTLDGKLRNTGGLTLDKERLSKATLEDRHTFHNLIAMNNLGHLGGGGGDGLNRLHAKRGTLLVE